MKSLKSCPVLGIVQGDEIGSRDILSSCLSRRGRPSRKAGRGGIVVISPDFLKKEWPQKELDGLTAREVDGHKVILPVWHNVDAETVRRHSPLLADLWASRSAKGVEGVVEDLMNVVRS